MSGDNAYPLKDLLPHERECCGTFAGTAHRATCSSYTKQGRVRQANKLLDVIASCGRQFFRYGSDISRFEVDSRGRIWFVDSYSKKRIYTAYRHDWRGFTNGGTLRTLIAQLRDYIRTGEPQPLHIGPWPEWICGGDLWGYGEDMEMVQNAACDLGITNDLGQRTGHHSTGHGPERRAS